MSHRALIPFHRMLAFTFLAGLALPAAAATDARVSESYGKLPLQFEANRGQTHKDVRFLSRGAGYSLYLTAGEAVLVLSKPYAGAKRDSRSTPVQGKSVALRMSLVGAASKPQVTGLDELPGKANYFIGKDRSKWRTNVPTYAKVQYQNVYPGIDLVYYGDQRQLEYDFVIAPGVNPKKIVLGFRGADKLEIDSQGELVLRTSGGDIRQHKPIIYQEIDGVRREIDGGYVRKGANRVGFQLAAYDTTRPLIIDPVVLSYSTYLGGSDEDWAGGIAVDADGNAYVTGYTRSTDFPTTTGAFQPTHSGGAFVSDDAFVTKLNSSGSALIYSTYLGGSGFIVTVQRSAYRCGNDRGHGIAVDASGNAYVTGETSSRDFPTTPGAFQPAVTVSIKCPGDAFVTKLDPSGSLLYSTYLGGNNTYNDGASGSGITVDSSGNAYVTGYTDSANFPTTPGAFQTTYADTSAYSRDAFVTKMNPTGSGLIYSTYLGGTADDGASGIAVDADGNVYVTGGTKSTNFPTTPAAAFPDNCCSISKAFVTKLNPAGTGLVYSTYLGGEFESAGAGIAVDADGNAYVTGSTTSDNFPTTPGAFQGDKSGTGEAFVTKFNPSGSALVYSTYLSGTEPRWDVPLTTGSGIAVDAGGNAYITGYTDSKTFPTTTDALQPVSPSPAGQKSAFVTTLNPTGSALVYSSYLGGSSDDFASGIAVDGSGNAYVTGVAFSTDFPTTAGAFQPTLGGGAPNTFGPDAFVAKIAGIASPPPPAPTRSEESAATEIGFWRSYGAEIGSFSGGTIVASNVAESRAMFSFTGTAVSWIGVKCNVCGIAAVSIDGGAATTVNTAGPNAPGSLTSESVFSASGLAASSHTISITVTGMSSSGGAYVAVDAFDVTASTATSPLLSPVVLSLPLVAVPPLPPILGL